MGLTSEDIRALLEAFEASTWQEMTVEVGGDFVHVSRSSTSPSRPAGPDAERLHSPAGDGRAAAVAAEKGHQPAAADESSATPVGGSAGPSQEVDQANGTPVTAPSVGVFWRAPSPGAPPFVDVGARVGPADAIGIIEIMKLMKPIPAGLAGVVTAILVDNGATVEHGQPLVLVDTEG
jgi:acetyl-CoA carboxylase biotin carboxyl carrier protein